MDRFGWGLELNLFIALSHTKLAANTKPVDRRHGPMDHGRDDLHTRFGCYVLQRIHLLLPKERIHVFAALWQRSNVGTEKTNRDRTCGCDAVCVRYLLNRSTVVRVYGPGDRCWDMDCFKLWMENFIDRVPPKG